jgi:CDGSH-type Zn-finger protein
MKKKPEKRKTSGLIKILKNGPYEVSGGIPLRKQIAVSNQEGMPLKWENGAVLRPGKKYYLCRCGRSTEKPFCNGTHEKVKFQGSETAGREKHSELAESTFGPALELKDAEKLCAISLFCHRAGDAWTLTENSGNKKSKETAIQEAADCPSGRLVAIDRKTGRKLEPKFKPGISLVEDPHRKSSGPLWVKGGVPIKSSKGWKYETRNRVTLCRCGRSANKPFCDGSHLPFKDGDESVK